MNNQQQQQQIVPSKQQENSEQEAYTWSFMRVAEGIAVNVVSAYIISLTAVVLLAIPSAVILFLQHAFHFFLVSTDILEIILIVGVTIIATLLIIVAILYFTFRHRPWTVGLTALGFFIGTIMDIRKPKIPEGIGEIFKAAQESSKDRANQHQ